MAYAEMLISNLDIIYPRTGREALFASPSKNGSASSSWAALMLPQGRISDTQHRFLSSGKKLVSLPTRSSPQHNLFK